MPLGQLKGELLQSRLEYVRSRHGPPTLERVLAALPPDDRERLRGVTRDAWYPFRSLVTLDRAIAGVVGGNPESLFVDLGRASARDRTEWLGEHAALVSVHGFLARMAEEHRRFHTFGRAEYRRLGFRHGQLSISDYPETDRSYCLGGLGYLMGAVELLSGSAAQVQERTCQCNGDAACCYDVRWKAAAPVPVR